MEPSQEPAERNALVQEIRAAFKGVSRIGGVSWRQAAIDDLYGYEEMIDYLDTDAQWEDLLENSSWRPDCGVGGWCFLDAISTRYYLPAAMIRAIEGDVNFAFHLDCRNEFDLSKFDLLDDRQQRCVARFLRYMDAKVRMLLLDDVDGAWTDCLAENGTDWGQAYEKYWHRFEA